MQHQARGRRALSIWAALLVLMVVATACSATTTVDQAVVGEAVAPDSPMPQNTHEVTDVAPASGGASQPEPTPVVADVAPASNAALTPEPAPLIDDVGGALQPEPAPAVDAAAVDVARQHAAALLASVEDPSAALTDLRAAFQRTIEVPAIEYEHHVEVGNRRSGIASGSTIGRFDRTTTAGELEWRTPYGTALRTERFLDDVLWLEDLVEANNRWIGLEDDSSSLRREGVEARLDPAWMLTLVHDALHEVVGVEPDGGDRAVWHVLVDVPSLGRLADVDIWGQEEVQASGTSFDRVVAQITVDADERVRRIDLDLTGWSEAHRPSEQRYRPPGPLSQYLLFDPVAAPLPLTAPCTDPIESSASGHGAVLQCPLDASQAVPRFVTVGYQPYPDANTHFYVLVNLLEELGYEVSLHQFSNFRVSEHEQYPALANGEIDVWASGWFPSDHELLAASHDDGGPLADHVVSTAAPAIAHGWSHGVLVPAAWADDWNVSTVDQINADPDLYLQFDRDGNGKGEIPGCDHGWSCFDWLEAKIESSWPNLEIDPRAYFAAADTFRERVYAGEAAIVVAMNPDARTELLGVGDSTTYLSIEGASPDPGAHLGQDRCRFADAACRLGFESSDFAFVVNRNWYEANPAGAALVEAVTIPAEDLSSITLAATGGEGNYGLGALRAINSQTADALAVEWIEQHRSLVDEWLAKARAAEPDWVPAEPTDDSDQDEGFLGLVEEPPTRREGDWVAWETAVLDAVTRSGALERGDDTEPLSIGASMICSGAAPYDRVVLHFAAQRDRYLDLDAQLDELAGFVGQSCDDLPTVRHEFGGIEVTEPVGDTWDELIDSAYGAAVPWASRDDFELLAMFSCDSFGGRLVRQRNGTSIGDGLHSETQLAHVGVLLERGCSLVDERAMRVRLLEARGREQLVHLLGPDFAERVSDDELDCMVARAAVRGEAPNGLAEVALFAPVCAPELVVEADTVRYVSDQVSKAEARCAAERLVWYAVLTGDVLGYFSPTRRAATSWEASRVTTLLTEGCGLTEIQIDGLGVLGR